MIKIVEVGPRDGLQNETRIFTLAERFQLVKDLSNAGIRHIEAGAFVSPKWVPQMAESDKLFKKIKKQQDQAGLPANVIYSALVPNMHGMDSAMKVNLKNIAVFGACTESFSKKNINCTIAESMERFKEVVTVAQQKKVKVRGYLSTAFGCPYEGKVSQAKVVRLTQALLSMGIYEVSIGDTIGVATPKQVRELIKKLKAKNIPLKKIAMHFHDTRGTALANVLASIEGGIKTFDSSIGSLGGCPYAKGASGNLATEDLVYMLNGMGLKSGVDLPKLISIHKKIQALLPVTLPSHVGRSGLPALKTF